MLDIFLGFLPLNRVLVKRRPIWFIQSLHREAGKQENESTTNEKRNRKRGHTGRKEEFSLSPPPCILRCHMDRTERVCVCVCVWPWMCHSDSQSVFQEPPTVPAAETELLRRLLTADLTLYGYPRLPPVSLPDTFPLSFPLAEAQCLRPIGSLMEA